MSHYMRDTLASNYVTLYEKHVGFKGIRHAALAGGNKKYMWQGTSVEGLRPDKSY